MESALEKTAIPRTKFYVEIREIVRHHGLNQSGQTLRGGGKARRGEREMQAVCAVDGCPNPLPPSSRFVRVLTPNC